MVLRLVAIVTLFLSPILGVEAVAAKECELCLAAVSLQTRDGQSWSAGTPVTLVVRVANHEPASLPSSGQAVVMQTDGDRTKCLSVPLKLVEGHASGGVY